MSFGSVHLNSFYVFTRESWKFFLFYKKPATSQQSKINHSQNIWSKDCNHWNQFYKSGKKQHTNAPRQKVKNGKLIKLRNLKSMAKVKATVV